MKTKPKAKEAGPSGMIVPPSKRGRFPCGSGCTVVMYTEAALRTHRAMCPDYVRTKMGRG